MRKMTNKEALAIINQNLSVDMSAFFQSKRPKMILGKEFIKDGVKKITLKCEACGNERECEETEINQIYWAAGSSGHISCPCCGTNSILLFNHASMQRKPFNIINMVKNGFCWIQYDVTFKKSYMSYGPIETIVTPVLAALFDYEHGWFVKTENNSMKPRASAQKVIQNEWEETLEIANHLTVPFKQLYDTACRKNEQLNEMLKVCNGKMQEEALMDVRANYKPKDLDMNVLKKAFKQSLFKIRNENQHGVEYVMECPKCGKKTVWNEKPHGICSCGCSVENVSCSYSKDKKWTRNTVVLFENTTLKENDLLIRVVEIEAKYENTMQLSYFEKTRLFVSNKLRITRSGVFNNTSCYADRFTWMPIENKALKNSGVCRSLLYADSLIQDNNEIKEIILSSSANKNGILEAYGLGNPAYHQIAQFPILSYIVAWGLNPSVELLVKANMTNFANEVVSDLLSVGRGTTLDKVLKVPHSMVKAFIKADPNYETWKSLSGFVKKEPNLTEEEIIYLAENKLNTNILLEIKNDYNIPILQSLRYIESAYNKQCIDRQQALTLWRDYLSMATAVKFNLTSNNKKFPSSLKREHDIAQCAYNNITISINRNQFIESAKANKRLEYADKDFVVIVPETPEDIVQEARNQDNCLRTYIERVKDRKTIVAFIRKKATPNKTYVTTEICGNQLVQVCGFKNTDPKDENLLKFLNSWAKEKKFEIAY